MVDKISFHKHFKIRKQIEHFRYHCSLWHERWSKLRIGCNLKRLPILIRCLLLKTHVIFDILMSYVASKYQVLRLERNQIEHYDISKRVWRYKAVGVIPIKVILFQICIFSARVCPKFIAMLILAFCPRKR